MRLGLIARADNSGLGMQTWEFYRHMQPAKTMVVDISRLNNNRIYPERYPGAYLVQGFPSDAIVREWLRDLDCVFIAEAAYNSNLYNIARQMGVKTAVQYNYEFMDWLINDNYPAPDMLIAPSLWHYQDVENYCERHNVKHVYLHCPVNRDILPFREIRQARTFLHVAGRSAAHDRNGTETVIKASKYVQSDAEIIVHFQGAQGLPHQATHNVDHYQYLLQTEGDPSKLTIIQNEYDNYADVYRQGDVLVLPRRYGGNCLPLNEALSIGMPVIMPDISPNGSLLPQKWLVKAEKINEFTPRTVIDIYDVNPEHLAHKIDYFYNLPEADFMLQNAHASNIAQSISWEYLRSKYQNTFEDLANEK